jgi:hypothetical protein
MRPQKGKIVPMGSGELTATMVEVHKGLLDHLPGPSQAAFLDTPAGLSCRYMKSTGTDNFGWQQGPAETRIPPKDSTGAPSSFWDKIHGLADRFHKGLEKRDPTTSNNALPELKRTIWQAQRDLESDEYISQARDERNSRMAFIPLQKPYGGRRAISRARSLYSAKKVKIRCGT